ncbi:hypothetical protein LX77_02800 [Gelidibacter algens]|jgi:hypothetical protein|uniref:Uncharacterized protein n=1 Tax=Gelidibacter algens TaxID=49280 RepID=A0A1A7R1K9_9FLAO|nr:hypothetical protein [Gelidibacter algens]OBX25711.1 hypothetical protein A9996_08110 [Gelidibacter algens]RAJ21047.1 hypothetical protein LX77_02800 [Gelidibacter algens]
MLTKIDSSLDIITKSLTVAVLQRKPEVFWFHLSIRKNVKTTFPNKYKFYEFFREMLCSSYVNSKGHLHLVIENPSWETEGYMHYNFYDAVHKHPRFYIKIKELEDNVLCFDMMPF